MKFKPLASLALIGALTLVSCKKELEPQDSPVTDATEVNTDAAAPALEITDTPGETPVQHAPQTVQPAATTSTPAAANRTASGVNPPHGQPGHRCDIAVGAPLSSPLPNAGNQPIKTSTITSNGQVTPGAPVKVTTTNNNPATPTLLQPQQDTPAGMNPPHGQPGHRCEIAVGAPLPK